MPGARWWGGLAVVGVLVGGLGVAAERGQPPAAATVGPVDFNAQVRPLLSDRCFRCHGPDASKRKAKLRLDTRDGLMKDLGDGQAVVTPRDPAASELIRRIFLPADDDDAMPPSDSHLALTSAEQDLLRRWVSEGAPYRGHWSFEPVRAAPVPTTAVATTNPIDAFVRARLASEGLAPAPAAPPGTLLRRLALGLTGLPPTRDEMDAFVSDTSPDAYARAIERYLASPAYGERMAVDWLDLARYADTYGYQADVTRDMSPYRDWVIRAFNDNLPYDQFLTWQLAGDLLPNPTRDQRVATAFNRLHRQTNEGGSIEEEFRTEYVADRVNTFGTAMLGVTLECARCHDHKFDAITQRDYFSLVAFFNSIDESGLYSHFTRATPTPALPLWPAHEESQHRELRDRMAAAEARLLDVAREARPAFLTWAASAALVPPAPIAHLTFDAVEGESTPDRVAATPARVQDGPVVIDGADRQEPGAGAFRFSGDNAVVHPGVRSVSRTDAFSLAIRLKPTEQQARAIVVHQSRAWTDAGSRGFELTLEEGKPFFGLVHFWPGNAVAVRAVEALPLDEWSHLVVTYDGSSRASGLRLYRNGVPMTTEVVRDRLSRDITYHKDAGDTAEAVHLTIGARFRDSGFKQGLVDDLQVFDVALTAVEVAGALSSDLHDATMLEHFLARHHVPYREALDTLRHLRAQENQLIAGIPEIMVMEELPEPRPTHLLARGSYDAPGDLVPRDTPASLPPFPADQPRNRLGLVRWLTSREHPLTARVAVNRIWRMHFGRGLVATPEDFGSQGRLPSHPELLDWLAARFMHDGWDVKALHTLIVSSDTYRQSSQASAELTRRDPDNEWLARGPMMRLQAEHIRDGALAASGLLTLTVGGPSVKPYQPEGLWEQSGTGQVYAQDSGDKLYRRSLYTFWRRTSPPPAMTAFDAVSREVCVARREVTMTPLQSLVLLNDPQFVEAARVLAEQLIRQFPRDVRARNIEAFIRLTGLRPDEREVAILAQAFAEQQGFYEGHPREAADLLGVGASPRDQSLPTADVAAMTAVANLIMNTDAFVRLR